MPVEFIPFPEGYEPEPQRVWTLTERTQTMSPDEHHWLTVEDQTPYWREQRPDWDGTYEEGDDHWDVDVEHPAECRYRDRHGNATCAVGWEIDANGLELGPVPGHDGRWRIEFWHHQDYFGEHDAGLEWVDGPEQAAS